MDVGFVLRTWFATLRHQRLLWKLGVLLLVAYLPFISVTIFLDLLQSNLQTRGLSEETLINWALGLAAVLLLSGLLSLGVNLVVNTGVILATAHAYPHPAERPVTWKDIQPHMARGFLRLLLLLLIIGSGLAIVFVLVFVLPFIAGETGLALIEERQASEPFGLAVLGMGMIGICWCWCGFPFALLLMAPFLPSTTVAVVVEKEQPFLQSIRRGLSQTWRKYGWWLLTFLGGIMLLVLLNLITVPFGVLSSLLGEFQSQGTQFSVSLFFNLTISGLAQGIGAIIGVLQTLALVTLYTVVYLHLRDQMAGAPSLPSAEQPLPTEAQEPFEGEGSP